MVHQSPADASEATEDASTPQPTSAARSADLATGRRTEPESRTPASAEPAEPGEALTSVVARLRAELEGVRRAMRNRAVIEQAKGVLAARLQLSPEDAFDHLLDLSQRTNVKLVEVAATLVGATAPEVSGEGDDGYPEPAATVAWRRPAPPTAPKPRSPEREALQSQQQLLASRIAAAESYDEIVSAIAETMTAWPGLVTVVLTLVEVDGALRLVASHGLTAEVRSQWRRIPPQADIPLTVSLRERTSLLLDQTQLHEQFPMVGEIAPGTRAMATLPLRSGEQLIGVLGLSWSEPVRLTGLARRYLTALAETCARAVAPAEEATAEPSEARAPAVAPQLVVERTLEHGLLPIVLGPLYDAAALLAPMRDGDQIVDFEFEYVNPAAAQFAASEHVDLANSTLLELFPDVGSRLLLQRYAEVLHTGRPSQLDDLHIASEYEGTRGSYTFVAHAARLGDRVLSVWRPRTDADLLHDQLLEAERISQAGSFWWNLQSGDLRWSPGMFRLFAQKPEEGAVRLDELAAHVHVDDRLGLRNAVGRVLGGRPASVEFRLNKSGKGRRLRLRVEPVSDERRDSSGDVTAIRGTVRDVTEERAAEARLRIAEEALAAQRMRMLSEEHAAASLRDAVLPTEPELATAPGLAVRGLCRSPEESGRVAGDWYDVLPLVGGRTVLTVGDVAGSGLAATTAAAQLRSAVRAYSLLGMSPAELLEALNRMLCELAPDRLATLLIADYEPSIRRLRWSAAGQSAPVRYRLDGSAQTLSGPIGVPVGAVPQVSYAGAELALAPGERILLYTDGLVMRRDTPTADGLEVLLQAGGKVDVEDLEALARHVTERLGSGPYDDLCLITARIL